MKQLNTLIAFAMLMFFAAPANALVITQTYSDGGDNGGIITFTDLGNNQLQIDFDNTSVATVFDSGYVNSSLITGLVFDIVSDIGAMSVVSFVDGNSFDLTSLYNVALNVDNKITPGNTVVDLSITTATGMEGGIYNSDDFGSELTNAFPDIATLVLDITTPDPWSLSSISNDILRMQRVGDLGEGSLKLSSVPEPSVLALMGLGLLGVVFTRRRKSVS